MIPARVLAAIGCALCLHIPTQAQWSAVAPADLSSFTHADFSDEELPLIPYLVHFHQVANAVVETGDNRGFIDISVWREPERNEPYNARIMENVLSLAWFYTADRPWNPYRGDPAVRVRLEAALDFIAGIQHTDGAFAEYGVGEWALGPTGFMTKFLGETLELLATGPAIDAAVLARAHETQSKAIEATLLRTDFYEVGKRYSNQFGNVWGGGLAWFNLHPEDTALRALWDVRWDQSRTDLQSPAGYFYEANGTDFGYTLGTHRHNSHSAWFYMQGTSLETPLLKKDNNWFDWLSYNTVLEPDEELFVINRAIETRQSLAWFRTHDTPLTERSELARAFASSQETRAAAIAAKRAFHTTNWPGVPPLAIGDFSAYSPYGFLHLRHGEWYPTAAEQAEARARLPYLNRDRFNHGRHDPRLKTDFLYVRRPGYYAAFTAGTVVTSSQRFGLGLLWRPDTGVLLQSQSRSADAAWGTRAAGAADVYEAASILSHVRVADTPVVQMPTAMDLPSGELSVGYRLGTQGDKTVAFHENEIAVDIRHPGAFEEQIPLVLAAGEQLVADPLGVRLLDSQGQTLVDVRADALSAAPIATITTSPLPARSLGLVRLPASEQLSYTIRSTWTAPTLASFDFEVPNLEGALQSQTAPVSGLTVGTLVRNNVYYTEMLPASGANYDTRALAVSPTYNYGSVYSITETLAQDTYLSVTLTVAEGQALSLNTLALNAAAGGTGGTRAFYVLSSATGFTADKVLLSDFMSTNGGADGGTLNARGTFGDYAVTLSDPAFRNITGTVEFRVYFQTQSSGARMDFDNIKLTGQLSPVPPPTPLAAYDFEGADWNAARASHPSSEWVAPGDIALSNITEGLKGSSLHPVRLPTQYPESQAFGFAPANAQTTYSLATTLANANYLSFTLTPEAGGALALQRLTFQAASGASTSGGGSKRAFYVFSSATGFDEADVLLLDSTTEISPGVGGTLPDVRGVFADYEVNLSDHPAFAHISEPVEFRIYIQTNGSTLVIDLDNVLVFGAPTTAIDPTLHTPAVLFDPTPPAGAVTLTNPDFEQSLTGWNNTNDNGMSTPTAEAAFTGEVGLRITDTSATLGSSLAGEPFGVTPGERLQVGFWSRKLSGDGAAVFLRFRTSSGALLSETVNLHLPGNLSWTGSSFEATVPAQAATAHVWVRAFSTSQSAFDLDEISVVRLP